MTGIDVRTEIREFLSSRRARITPQQAGLPAYGGNRRVQGLRREEVAMLAGVSVDYYVRMERGSLHGVSDSVLESLASALQLDEAEHDHLIALARQSGTGPTGRRTQHTGIRPVLQQVLDAVSDAPAWIRNGRHDILAMNQLARALYAPVLATPVRPANTTRFVYLEPDAAREFFVDYDQVARDAAAMLRLEAGRNPHDKALIALVGELSTRSELFRKRWASQDVRFHRSGRKRLRHPVVGQADLDFRPSRTLRTRPATQHLPPPPAPNADALSSSPHGPPRTNSHQTTPHTRLNTPRASAGRCVSAPRVHWLHWQFGDRSRGEVQVQVDADEVAQAVGFLLDRCVRVGPPVEPEPPTGSSPRRAHVPHTTPPTTTGLALRVMRSRAPAG